MGFEIRLTMSVDGIVSAERAKSKGEKLTRNTSYELQLCLLSFNQIMPTYFGSEQRHERA